MSTLPLSNAPSLRRHLRVGDRRGRRPGDLVDDALLDRSKHQRGCRLRREVEDHAAARARCLDELLDDRVRVGDRQVLREALVREACALGTSSTPPLE